MIDKIDSDGLWRFWLPGLLTGIAIGMLIVLAAGWH